jgi:hypothetical protein
MQETPRGSLTRESGNVGGARAYIPNEGMNWFYHTNLSRLCAGCGRLRSRNIFFGNVLIALRQGLQRRDAVAAGKEQIGR